MPENQDTKNTTDQGRSGGAQTQKSDREGQGSSPETRDQSGGHAAGAKREPIVEGGGQPIGSDSEEDQEFNQGNRSDSKDSNTEWSPSSGYPDA